MDVIVRIPDDLAKHLGAGNDIARRVLEALALEEFKCGHLTKPELRRLLGFEIGAEVDAFLVSHGVFGTYTEADLARDREDLQRLGF